MKIYNKLPNTRIHSIDLFRGLTILLMIFVNELAGMRNIPQWLRHMPADADAMTITDWVFPGFLFIVGMSIPFAINRRIQKGDNFLQLQKHILVRTLGLLVLGFFMVNAEGGYNEDAMLIPINLWKFLVYPFVILVWNIYRFENKNWEYLLRGIGIIGLILLAYAYRGGESGNEFMKPQWWGILGLIGWAYLYASIYYQLVRGNKYLMLAGVALGALIFIAGKTDISTNFSLLHWTQTQAEKATLAGIVLSGIVLTLIMFDENRKISFSRKLLKIGGFILALILAGLVLRPGFQISKIYATPSWGFYSSAFSCFLFICLYWFTDKLGINKWTKFIQPAGSNALLTYIIPFIIASIYSIFHFYPLPYNMQTGIIGVIYCITYGVIILLVVKFLNSLNIKLQL